MLAVGWDWFKCAGWGCCEVFGGINAGVTLRSEPASDWESTSPLWYLKIFNKIFKNHIDNHI